MPSDSASSSRKLAAILFADIQGYTAMMQSDEGTALHRLRHYQSVLKKQVALFNGEIVKNYGDGSLCLFSSVLDSVKCAQTLQVIFQQEPKIPLRIGIHLGDVTFEENDIYGNAINLASRIESIGVPGSVLMSNDIYRKVQNQTEFQFQSLGTVEFKNVEESMHVFALANEGFAIPNRDHLKGKIQQRNSRNQIIKIGAPIAAFAIIAMLYFILKGSNPEIESTISEKSIAVLPFADLSPNKDQEYFSDGMMEEILNHLVKIKGLQVSSRTSSMTYKGKDLPASTIAQEMGVATILEGSVRKSGNAIRITVQFIDGKTDTHLWSEIYDGLLDNIFEVQSDIALQVADKLRAEISPGVKERINIRPTENMQAYSNYLEARAEYSDPNRVEDLLLQAIDLDPEFGEAYVSLGITKAMKIIFTRDIIPEDFDVYLSEIKDLLTKGSILSPNYPESYIWLGALALWFDWDFNKTQEYYDKALQLNPSLPLTAVTEYLLSTGRFEDALQNSFSTIQGNHNSTNIWIMHGMAHYFLGNKQKVLECIEIAKSKAHNIVVNGNYQRLLVYLGRYEEAIANYKILNEDQMTPRALGFAAVAHYHDGNQDATNELISELKLQSEISPIGSPAFHVAMIYAQMNKLGLAFEWLEKAYQDKEVEMYWLMVEPPFSPLYNDPRWEEMLFKVGFEIPLKG